MENDALDREIAEAAREYERLFGGYATYTHRMLDQLGSVAALGRLVSEARIQKGLKTLAKAGKLDLSFEAVILRHPSRFTKSVFEAAEWRFGPRPCWRFRLSRTAAREDCGGGGFVCPAML